jgi:hypothetical protein
MNQTRCLGWYRATDGTLPKRHDCQPVFDSVRITSETLRIALERMTKTEQMRRTLLNLRDTDDPESR